ncbi:MAG: response regulator [Candidatus Saganbacteria bacterium]|uniref:Response regulator n=1 Tax=Candidatus Saganbacteria bacterium TaxID=2575572 RepID=A0A833NZT6_UNCSA|nr:MAG: response regulator [Candidatus Saganbacteria bacterium]
MGKPLVLVVDDEPDMANYIAKVVREAEKYNVVIAHNGKEAFEALEKNRSLFGLGDTLVGCVLLDIKMPEMDGLQFLEKLRKEYEKRIGVIIVSAYEDQEKWGKAMEGFVAGYLRKPFNNSNLLAYLDMFFTNPQFAIQQSRERLFGERFHASLKKEKKNNTI